MNKLSITFGDLTHEMVNALTAFHLQLVTGVATVANVTGAIANLADALSPLLAPGNANTPAVPSPANIPASTANGGNSQPPVFAGAAAPSTSKTPVTVSAPVDSRGVPWNEQFHAGKPGAPIALPNGNWRTRKGAASTIAAYEAPFLQKPAVGNVTPIRPGAADAGFYDSHAPAPTPTPTPSLALPEGVPDMGEFLKLWGDLVARKRVNADLSGWLNGKFGGFPGVSERFVTDLDARKEAYEVFERFAA